MTLKDVATANPDCPAYFVRPAYKARRCLLEMTEGLKRLHLKGKDNHYNNIPKPGMPSPTGTRPQTADGSGPEIPHRSKVHNGVTVAVLEEMAKHIPPDYSVKQVVDELIIPASKPHYCSVLDIPGILHSRFMGPPEVMVSTSWSAPFHGLVKAIQQHAEGMPHKTYWFDFLAAFHQPSKDHREGIVNATKAAAKGAKLGLAVITPQLPQGGTLGDFTAMFQLWCCIHYHGPKALDVVATSGISGADLGAVIHGYASDIHIIKARVEDDEHRLLLIKTIQSMYSTTDNVNVELMAAFRMLNPIMRLNITSVNGQTPPAQATKNAKLEPQDDDLPNWVRMVRSSNVDDQTKATQSIRTMLSKPVDPPINDVIRTGVIPTLVEFLQRTDAPVLQYEAAWALTNVASGTSDQTRVVVDAGAVPLLVQLLKSPSDDVRGQAVWALGNIAGDSPHHRDYVFGYNPLPALLELLTEDSEISMLRNATWALSNFCRGKPPLNFQTMQAALPTLARLICHDDDEVVLNACWSLSYLPYGDHNRIDKIIEAGVCPRLIELLMGDTATAALRTLSDIASGSDKQTQHLVDLGALNCMKHLLANERTKKEACFTVSNVTAGTQKQIQAVIQAGLIPPLVNLLATAEFGIKKEAAWAICNVASGGSAEQIRLVAESGAIEPLRDLLSDSNIDIKTRDSFQKGLASLRMASTDQSESAGTQ